MSKKFHTKKGISLVISLILISLFLYGCGQQVQQPAGNQEITGNVVETIPPTVPESTPETTGAEAATGVELDHAAVPTGRAAARAAAAAVGLRLHARRTDGRRRAALRAVRDQRQQRGLQGLLPYAGDDQPGR